MKLSDVVELAGARSGLLTPSGPPPTNDCPEAASRELEATLRALRSEVHRGAWLRSETRRLYGGLLPRFLARLLEDADDSAREVERLCLHAQELSRTLAGDRGGRSAE